METDEFYISQFTALLGVILILGLIRFYYRYTKINRLVSSRKFSLNDLQSVIDRFSFKKRKDPYVRVETAQSGRKFVVLRDDQIYYLTSLDRMALQMGLINLEELDVLICKEKLNLDI